MGWALVDLIIRAWADRASFVYRASLNQTTTSEQLNLTNINIYKKSRSEAEALNLKSMEDGG